jgi:hypothetical protein
VFRRPSIRISAETLSVLKDFCGFLQTFQANFGIVSRLGQNLIFENLLQFVIHQSAYHSTLYTLDSDSGVKLPIASQEVHVEYIL